MDDTPPSLFDALPRRSKAGAGREARAGTASRPGVAQSGASRAGRPGTSAVHGTGPLAAQPVAQPSGWQPTPAQQRKLDDVLAMNTKGPLDGIFTDGGCRGNPGPGGWGAVVVHNDGMVVQDAGYDRATTNNRMEYTAIIRGLELAPDTNPGQPVPLYTDSKLAVQSLNEWVHGWKRKGWKKSSGPIKNLELIQRAHALHEAKPWVHITWIRAHSGNRWNEYVDTLVNIAMG